MPKSFILHLDSLCILDKLSPEQKGHLFQAIYSYQLTGEVPEMDSLTEIVFTPFLNQFKRDFEKYMNTVKRNKENGKKGGRPKKETQQNPKNQSGFSITQENPIEPKKPYSDSKNDSDSDSNSDSNSKSDNLNSKFSFLKSLIQNGADKKIAEDWLKVRKIKKAANTETAFNIFISEVEKSKLQINEVLSKCIEKNWMGFKAEWLKKDVPEVAAPKLNYV